MMPFYTFFDASPFKRKDIYLVNSNVIPDWSIEQVTWNHHKFVQQVHVPPQYGSHKRFQFTYNPRRRHSKRLTKPSVSVELKPKSIRRVSGGGDVGESVPCAMLQELPGGARQNNWGFKGCFECFESTKGALTYNWRAEFLTHSHPQVSWQ